MDELLIRELRPDEVETIVDIALLAWEPIFAWYRETMGEEIFQVMIPDWRKIKGGQIRSACAPESGALAFVAEKAGRVVGFVTCYAHREAGWGEIGNNAVHPDYQGQGIAPRLYERALQSLRDAGIACVKVSTGGDPAHAPARRAYEKAGFGHALPSVTYHRKL